MDGIEYADAISDIVRGLSELQRKMAEVEEEFSGQENSLEALQKKHEILQKVLEKQAEKQEILTRTLRQSSLRREQGKGQRRCGRHLAKRKNRFPTQIRRFHKMKDI